MADDWRKYLPQGTPAAAPAGDDGDWQKYLPKKTSGAESFLRGAAQELSLGFADEIAGAAESAFSKKTYKQARDESRANYAKAEADNPALYTGGQVAGGLATLAVPVGLGARALGTGLKGAAALGAAYGAGTSDADLTEGDIRGVVGDAAIGAGAGALAHGAVGLAGKAVKAVAPKAKAALRKYAESETEDILGGVTKSTLGRAALGAAGGVYSGDEDAVGNAVKGAALGVAVPAAHRLASKAVKAAILAALERGGRKEAAKVSRALVAVRNAASAEAEPAVAGASRTAAEAPMLEGMADTETRGIAGKAEPLALAEYTPPGGRRAVASEPGRLALGPVPEAEGRGIRLGPTEGGEEAATAAIPLRKPRRPRTAKKDIVEEVWSADDDVVRKVKPGELMDVLDIEGKPIAPTSEARLASIRKMFDTRVGRRGQRAVDELREPIVAVSPGGRMEIVDGRHRLLVARERGEPIKVRLTRGSAALDESAAAPPAAAPVEAPATNLAKEEAIAEFKQAVAKAKRLQDSGDKLRARTWLAAAEKKFKAAMRKAGDVAGE